MEAQSTGQFSKYYWDYYYALLACQCFHLHPRYCSPEVSTPEEHGSRLLLWNLNTDILDFKKEKQKGRCSVFDIVTMGFEVAIERLHVTS